MNAAIAVAVSDTDANSDAVGTLDTVFSDPKMEEMLAKINELISALRRQFDQL